jgi:hypothetical protein
LATFGSRKQLFIEVKTLPGLPLHPSHILPATDVNVRKLFLTSGFETDWKPTFNAALNLQLRFTPQVLQKCVVLRDSETLCFCP